MSKVTGFIKVAESVPKKERDTNPMWDVEYEVGNEILTKPGAFIYTITETPAGAKMPRIYIRMWEMMKIGGGHPAGGVKAMIAGYIAGNGGQAFKRSHGIHLFIFEALERGSRIGWHVKFAPITNLEGEGLYGQPQIFSISSYKEMERSHISDYEKKMGEPPPWNIQERKGAEWPERVNISMRKMHQKSLQAKRGRKTSG